MKGPIIVIEDDKDDQEILQEVFADLEINNELRFFNDCEQAYEYLTLIAEKPFLIICDINLPRMNGIELKLRIDKTDQLRKKAIPFVFLTTSDAQQTIEAAYSITNLQGYFQKSLSMEELKNNIKLIIDYWRTTLHPL